MSGVYQTSPDKSGRYKDDFNIKIFEIFDDFFILAYRKPLQYFLKVTLDKCWFLVIMVTYLK